jgi:glycosyltransferase involved in cell wall biosynthesis
LKWVSERDQGQADAINKGIRATTGDVVGYLNSDDIYYPGALVAVQNFFEANPEIEVVYGEADHIDSEGRVLESYPTGDWDYNRLKEVCFLCQPAVFFRRRLTERAGLFDAELMYSMDYEYWLRLGAICRFARLPVKLAGSRMHRENKTLGFRVAVHHEINDMLKKRLGAVPQRWIFNYAHAVRDQKGYDRAKPLEDMRYTLGLIAISFFAFLRWNHKLPRQAAITMGGWALGSLRNVVRMTV